MGESAGVGVGVGVIAGTTVLKMFVGNVGAGELVNCGKTKGGRLALILMFCAATFGDGVGKAGVFSCCLAERPITAAKAIKTTATMTPLVIISFKIRGS